MAAAVGSRPVGCGLACAEPGPARRGADAADSAARAAPGGAGRGAARRRDAARLSVETRGPPALAARAAARPPRALVTRRSPRFVLPTIVNYIPISHMYLMNYHIRQNFKNYLLIIWAYTRV